MSDYIHGRVYQRGLDGLAWNRTHEGSHADMKQVVQDLIGRLGQPVHKNIVESEYADVILLGFSDGHRVRVCFDKKHNYEVIHCPSCCRLKLPPPYAETLVECSHGWSPSWVYDDSTNTWRCREVTRA